MNLNIESAGGYAFRIETIEIEGILSAKPTVVAVIGEVSPLGKKVQTRVRISGDDANEGIDHLVAVITKDIKSKIEEAKNASR